MVRTNTGRRGRRVVNLMDGDLTTMAPTTAAGGTVAYEDGGRVAVFTVPSGAGVRAMLTRTITGLVQAGRTYAFSARIDALSAPHGSVVTANGVLLTIGAGTPPTFGPQSGNNSIVNLGPTVPTLDGCRVGLIFTPSVLGSVIARIGYGCNSTETNALAVPVVLKMSDIQLEELAGDNVGPSEYVGGFNIAGLVDRSAVFDYAREVELSQVTQGVVRARRGPSYPIRRPSNICIIGDSFANDSNDFPALIQAALPDAAVTVYAVSGGTLATINAFVPDAFRDRRALDRPAPDHVLIQSTLNDAFAGSVTLDPVIEQQARIRTIVARARAVGVRNISIANLTPAAAAATYSATSGDQVRIEQYNAWLVGYCAAEGIGHIDMYRGLGVGYPNGRIPAVWQATTAYAAQAIVRPVTANQLVYMVTAGGGGNSGAAEPTWPTTLGGTVVDGALTWTAYRAVLDPALSGADELHPDTAAGTGMQRYADLCLPHLVVNNRAA